MKQTMIKCGGVVLLLLFGLLAGPLFSAEDTWKKQSELSVSQSGLVGAVLPLELMDSSDGKGYDLSLLGPDGNPRAFELFWRRPDKHLSSGVEPLQVSFRDSYVMEWTGKVKKPIRCDRIFINISDRDFIAKVDIDGYENGEWVILKRNETIYRAVGQSRLSLTVKPGDYEKIRLVFSGFNPKYKEKFTPVTSVSLTGTEPGKGVVKEEKELLFKPAEMKKGLSVRASLPGSGVWIKSLEMFTQVQFKGNWSVGYERIKNGEKKFVSVKSGRISHVMDVDHPVKIDVDLKWAAGHIIVRLEPADTYIGEISTLKALFYAPRLVFPADMPGRYTMKTGLGRNAMVMNQPSVSDRHPDGISSWGDIIVNPEFKPLALVDRFRIKGAGFNPDGYAWKQGVTVDEKGYYRLILSFRQRFDHLNAVRIVKDDTQVPFLFGNTAVREMDLTKEAETDFDEKLNRTRITIPLTVAPERLISLTLHSKGIFKRTLYFEVPKPGKMGYRQWRQKVWAGTGPGPSRLNISMGALPPDAGQIRIVMDHKDNQAITVDRITASFSSPTLLFLAGEPGRYEVFGGRPGTARPEYDLALVQSFMLEQVPQDIVMEAAPENVDGSFGQSVLSFFKDKAWGLYVTLGLLTIVLLIVIAKLFPKVPRPDEK